MCSLLYHLLLVQNVYDFQCANVHWFFFSKKHSLFYYLLLVENCRDFWHASIWMFACFLWLKPFLALLFTIVWRCSSFSMWKHFIICFISSWKHFLFYYLLLVKGIHGFLCVNFFFFFGCCLKCSLLYCVLLAKSDCSFLYVNIQLFACFS
jgi:hypothetical protein